MGAQFWISLVTSSSDLGPLANMPITFLQITGTHIPCPKEVPITNVCLFIVFPVSVAKERELHVAMFCQLGRGVQSANDLTVRLSVLTPEGESRNTPRAALRRFPYDSRLNGSLRLLDFVLLASLWTSSRTNYKCPFRSRKAIIVCQPDEWQQFSSNSC